MTPLIPVRSSKGAAKIHRLSGLLHDKENAASIYVESLVVVLGGNGGSRYRLRTSGIRKQYIQLGLLGRDRLSVVPTAMLLSRLNAAD